MSALPALTENRHPLLRRLDAEMQLLDPAAGEAQCLDASFLSRSFCLSGLPLRKLVKRKAGPNLPAEESDLFSRCDGRFSLSIGTQPFVAPGGQRVSVGLPYGPRARLLVIWMTTQARAQGSRWLEIGKIEDWLSDVGITPHAEAAAMAKEQLIRLSHAHFTMVMNAKRGDKEAEEKVFFRSEKLIDSTIFDSSDILEYLTGERKLVDVRYPVGLELSANAYDRFTGNDVIAVSTESLRQISNNAMAIDLLMFLSYKLPIIPRGEMELLTWERLIKQFGNGECRSKFRQVFGASIDKALAAFGRPDVKVTEHGLELRYSDPAPDRRLFSVVSRRKESLPITKLKNRLCA